MAIMGFAGLAIDGGNVFTQRRLVQNGADAAALVGARDIATGSFSSIDTHATTYAQANAGPPATAAWTYVNSAGATVTQSNATGVSVLVTKTVNTWFMRALGVPDFTVSARGTAQTQLVAGAMGAPFIVCASGLTRSLTAFAGGLLDYTTSPPSIREEAVGTDFVVHGSKVGQSDPNGDCDWSSSAAFKGNTPPGTVSGCTTLPCYYPFDNGTRAGPSRNRIAGLPGCNEIDENLPNGCVAILPIAAMKNSAGDTCPGPDPSNSMCVVAWGAFQLREGGQAGDPSGCTANNCHIGRLLGNVIVTEGVGVDRAADMTGPMVVRLLG